MQYMDQFQYSHTQIPSMKHKKRLTEEQVRVLEISFSFKNKLDPETKTQLARQLGVPTRQVAIWYQNRRAREKTQSLEADHNALQLRIENVLQDNAKLKEESKWLKAELIRIQNMSNDFNSASSCESQQLIKKQNLEREFYDCLVGGVGQFLTSDGHKFSGSSAS